MQRVRMSGRRSRRGLLTATAVFAVLVAIPSAAVAGDIALEPWPLPDGTIGQPYSVQLYVLATPGVTPQPPFTYRLNGNLPQGLSMSSSGLISGTPLLTQTASFTLAVFDSAGNSSGGRDYTLTVGSGNSDLDSALVPAGTNTLADLAIVEQQVTQLGGLLNPAYLLRVVGCIPSTISTLINHTPPSC
jgi:hypothetical protein